MGWVDVRIGQFDSCHCKSVEKSPKCRIPLPSPIGLATSSTPLCHTPSLTLNPKPQTLRLLVCSTPSYDTQTPNPKPSTLNPQPQTLRLLVCSTPSCDALSRFLDWHLHLPRPQSSTGTLEGRSACRLDSFGRTSRTKIPQNHSERTPKDVEKPKP